MGKGKLREFDEGVIPAAAWDHTFPMSRLAFHLHYTLLPKLGNILLLNSYFPAKQASLIQIPILLSSPFNKKFNIQTQIFF